MPIIMWNILRGLVTLIEAFVMTYFVFAFQGFCFKKSTMAKYIISSVIYAFLILIIFDENLLLPIKELIYAIYFFLASLLLIKSKLHTKLLAAIICVVVDFAVKIIVPAGFEDVLLRFLAQLINLIVYAIILQATKNRNIKLDKKEWIMIFSVVGLSFVGVALLNLLRNHLSDDTITFLICLEICFILISAVCFYMTFLLNKSKKESETLKLISQQNEYRYQYADNTKKQYDEIRSIRHDMRQAYSVIFALLKENKTDEAADFIQTNMNQITDMEMLVDVGDDIINALLNSKLTLARQQGIKVICNLDSSIINIDRIDLCSLLGNLLDNAIEACVKCEAQRRIIELEFKRVNDIYLIEVSNSVSGSVLEQNKQLNTTKSDTKSHGFGIKSIRSIAEKYNGSVNFVQEDDVLRCDVVLMK